jgi:hypothetical protein
MYLSYTYFRCFVGQNSGPAQRPDANRYVEGVMVKLCNRYPGPIQRDGITTNRWSLIQKDYRSIREMVTVNERVMSETAIQLFDVNTSTVQQW